MIRPNLPESKIIIGKTYLAATHREIENQEESIPPGTSDEPRLALLVLFYGPEASSVRKRVEAGFLCSVMLMLPIP